MIAVLDGMLARALRAPVAALVAATLALTSTIATAQTLGKLEITTGTGPHVFSVEVVDDEAGRERGLMYRRYLPADRGMLFDFKEEAPVAFWMKNTFIPLDMVFISKKGLVTNIFANAEPLSEHLIPSGGPAYAVLEINGGLAARIGLKVGDRVKHPVFSP